MMSQTILNRLKSKRYSLLIIALALVVFVKMHLPIGFSQATPQQVVKKSVRLVATGSDANARGRVNVSHQQTNRREIQELSLSVRNLNARRNFSIVVDGTPIGQLFTNSNGSADLKFARGGFPIGGSIPLPRSIGSVLEAQVVEIMNDQNERILRANLATGRDDVRTINQIRVLNRNEEVVFEGTLTPSSASDVKTTMYLTNMGQDVDATAEVSFFYKQLSQGIRQGLTVQVHRLNEEGPYMLFVYHVPAPGSGKTAQVIYPECEPFITPSSGEQEVSAENESGSGESEPEDAVEAIEEAQEDIAEAQAEINAAQLVGADVTDAQATLAQAEAKLADAQAAFDAGDFATAETTANEAESLAEEAEELARDAVNEQNGDDDDNDNDDNDNDDNDNDDNDNDDNDNDDNDNDDNDNDDNDNDDNDNDDNDNDDNDNDDDDNDNDDDDNDNDDDDNDNDDDDNDNDDDDNDNGN